MYHSVVYSVIITFGLLYDISCTIDINFSEFEYLAARLNPFECRRLIAALHYTSYELPRNLAAAERTIDQTIPCLRHLLHWNSSPNEGLGKTHESIAHRLRQINRNDLANWLSKMSFKQLSKDIESSLQDPFGKVDENKTETSFPLTDSSTTSHEDEDYFLPFDTILIVVLLGLLGTLLILIGAIIFHRIKLHMRRVKYTVAK